MSENYTRDAVALGEVIEQIETYFRLPISYMEYFVHKVHEWLEYSNKSQREIMLTICKDREKALIPWEYVQLVWNLVARAISSTSPWIDMNELEVK